MVNGWRISVRQATVFYGVPKSTISDKILNKFLLINVHLNVPLAPNTVISDNTIWSVRNLVQCRIITFCIKIYLECNYSIALFIKTLFHCILEHWSLISVIGEVYCLRKQL